MDRLEIAGKYARMFSEINPYRCIKRINPNNEGVGFVMAYLYKNRDKTICAGDLAKALNVSTARVAAALNKLEEHKLLKSTKIKIWSAGCSTGEEPYTIAMLLKDKLPAPYTFEIKASDISLRSLLVGKQGFYQNSKITGIPENYLERFFTKTSDGYQVKPELMSTIRFDYHNLAYDSGVRDLDIVFCRNVLIYFDEAAQKNTIDKFWNSMAKESYLFIGHSESLFGMNTKFKFLKTDWACLYEKDDK